MQRRLSAPKACIDFPLQGSLSRTENFNDLLSSVICAGAVAISFCLFGTSMLFVTSHLTAHQQKIKERVSDVKKIIHSIDLPRNLNIRSKNKDVTQNFDMVFWCGDLNFRLSEPREKLLKWIETTQFPLPSHLPHGFMHTDQLKSILSNGAAFKDFKEANITFPPTYKYDPGMFVASTLHACVLSIKTNQ